MVLQTARPGCFKYVDKNNTDGMNPSSNPPGQHADPAWVTTDNWDTNNTSTTTSITNSSQYQATAATRPEWDWENPMLLAATAQEIVDADRKPQQQQQLVPLPTASLLGGHRPTYASPTNYIPPHHGFITSFTNSATSMRSFASPAGGAVDGYHPHPHPHQHHHHHHHHHQHQQQQQQQHTLGGGGVYDLNAAELRSYEQRRRFLGMQMLETSEHSRSLPFELVKREDMYSTLEAHGRIGLNLGGRTYFSAEDSARLGPKRSRMNALGSHVPMCQVQGCSADLSKAKHYHRRHKVCEIHSKAPNVIANGQTQRFCQQCSRFHQLAEFDDTKRSCRKRLADHNRRRRKPQPGALGATISEPLDQSTNMRAIVEGGDHKPILLQMQKSGSPTPTVTDRDGITGSGANRSQVQSSTAGFGSVIDEKISGRNTLLRSAQPLPSSDVQALVLSVVSRTPPSAHSTRQSPGTQESVYQQYLHGPSLSLSSAGMASQTQQHNSSPSHNYSSIEQQQQHTVPWLAGTCSNSRSTFVQQGRTLQSYPPPAREGGHGHGHGHQMGSPQYMVHLPGQASAGEQLGRLGLQSTATTMDGHQMLALIENPAQQQQLTSSVDDVKPLHHSDLQSSGVRSSFGSSFYDSSSSIG